MYQIHEVCERCHLSRKAIRLYEEKGLLHPDRIQGNRMYNKEDVVGCNVSAIIVDLGFLWNRFSSCCMAAVKNV